MTFKRNILRGLEAWKNDARHKPLVIRGARQTGKTTAVQDFGKGFDTFIALNLEKGGDRSFFTDDMNPVLTFRRICLERNIRPRGKVLLFLDEVQHSPAACRNQMRQAKK